jgi:hypothetical protein
MSHHTPTPAERSAALNYALHHWKSAHSLRYEDKCPVRHCRKPTQWSVQIDGDDDPAKRRTLSDGAVHEPCAFYCMSCGFSNGGSRPVENDEVME